MPDLTHETVSLMEQYKEACNYPGRLDEAAVQKALGEYCRAVGAQRRIERLRCDWVHTAGDDFWACVVGLMRTVADGAKNAFHVVAFDAIAVRDARAAKAAIAALSGLNVFAGVASGDIEASGSIAAQEARKAASVSDARVARDVLSDLYVLAARAARDALDGLDGLVGDAPSDLYILAARAARDAIDARRDRGLVTAGEAVLRFTRWTVHHHAWLWWWEMSNLAATYFGAASIGKPAVVAWARPVLDAFLNGCWMLFWTDKTLYWVAKPVVHVESSRDGVRLHCDNGPALASDVEHLYFVHGVMVPEAVVARPETLTAQDVRREENEEVRRIMIERMGWPRYLQEAAAVVLHRRVNAIDATKEALMQSEDGSRVLVCSCPSTGRVYGMRVPRHIDTCDQAQSWLSGDAAGRTIGAS